MMSLGLTLESNASAKAEAGLVGPNAVIQLAEALRALAGEDAAERVFTRAGYRALLHALPDRMIDEAVPADLFLALRQEFSPEQAACIAHDAGLRTGEYILANRIPGFAKLLLKLLPRSIACRVLLQAIRKNAWTFAGSGDCSVYASDGAIIEIAGNPLAMPCCPWHVGVFEQLFRTLVSRETRIQHGACCASGQNACRFEVVV